MLCLINQWFIFISGEYILLGQSEGSNSAGESESLPTSEDEEKQEEPVDQEEEEEDSGSFSLDKAFGFVDFDEVSRFLLSSSALPRYCCAETVPCRATKFTESNV